MSEPRVLGVDGDKRGWVGIAIQHGVITGYLADRISTLVDSATGDGAIDFIAIDIPIGLPDRGRRQADEEARRRVGRRWNSVFMTPTRGALEATDYAAAQEAANRAAASEGVSKQAYALRARILEVEEWSRGQHTRVFEVHPEVSFAELAQEPLEYSKSTWAGIQHRRQLLREAGIHLPDDLGEAASAGVADVLDAGAAAWTARRVALGEAVSIPTQPEQFSDGWPAAIWA